MDTNREAIRWGRGLEVSASTFVRSWVRIVCGMADVHLTPKDEGLWRGVRHEAVERGVTVTSIVEDALRLRAGGVTAAPRDEARVEVKIAGVQTVKTGSYSAVGWGSPGTFDYRPQKKPGAK